MITVKRIAQQAQAPEGAFCIDEDGKKCTALQEQVELLCGVFYDTPLIKEYGLPKKCHSCREQTDSQKFNFLIVSRTLNGKLSAHCSGTELQYGHLSDAVKLLEFVRGMYPQQTWYIQPIEVRDGPYVLPT